MLILLVIVVTPVGLAPECLCEGCGGGEREREGGGEGSLGGGECERGSCDDGVWGEGRPGAVCGRCDRECWVEVEMRAVRLATSLSLACQGLVRINIYMYTQAQTMEPAQP